MSRTPPDIPSAGASGGRGGDRVTAAILEALRRQAGDAIWAAELALSSGARRCDFWTLQVQASKGYQATAFEIKVSRGDFRRDHAVKQREARLFSDRFYYVAPAGLLAPAEIPDWAGLKEWSADNGLTTRLPAPLRDKDAPTWELVVSLFRNAGEIGRDVGLMKSELAMLRHNLGRREAELAALGAQARQLMVENLRLRQQAPAPAPSPMETK